MNKEPKSITILRFLEEYNGAPYSEDELAYIARLVNGELGSCAQDFIDARDNFLLSLEENGYIWG